MSIVEQEIQDRKVEFAEFANELYQKKDIQLTLSNTPSLDFAVGPETQEMLEYFPEDKKIEFIEIIGKTFGVLQLLKD